MLNLSIIGRLFRLRFNYEYLYLPMRFKHILDYSLIPTISENDLEEQFVRGSGPGGSAVNKNSNCVVLTHKPTGIVIKAHSSRSLDHNRKIARELLIDKLDVLKNGDRSIRAQIKASEDKKSRESERRRKKLDLLKSEWKKREGIE